MKRKTALCLLAIVITILTIFALAACNKREQPQEKSDVSRITLDYFAGESEQFAVSVERGEREKQFIADGKTTDVSPFAEIKIVPLQKNDYEEIGFELVGEDKTLSGKATDAARGEFVSALDLDFVPSLVKITAGEESFEIELCDVLDGKIAAKEAIDVARNAFKDKLEEESAQGKPAREVYCKLITGDRLNYYYYVSFIGDGVDYWAALIDPADGSIASKK